MSNPLGFKTRQGHTELAVGLARLAQVAPVVIGAEMLQKATMHFQYLMLESGQNREAFHFLKELK